MLWLPVMPRESLMLGVCDPPLAPRSEEFA